MDQIYEDIYKSKITRTGEVLNFEVRAGTIKVISINAPQLSPIGEHTFNMQKNGVDLLEGAERITINTGNKRVEKTDADFGEITTVDGDIISLTVDTLGTGGVMYPVYFFVVIDDGVSGGGNAADEISVEDSSFEVLAGDDVQSVLESADAAIEDLEDSKQDALVSGTNIKTVNGNSIVGSGDLIVGSIPQNSQSTAYTAVIGDANGHIYHPSSDNNARTFTIPANSSVAYPIGTTLTFINEINTVTIAITTDTLVLAGTGATGSRTLAANGMATAIKVTSTRWIISGTNLS